MTGGLLVLVRVVVGVGWAAGQVGMDEPPQRGLQPLPVVLGPGRDAVPLADGGDLAGQGGELPGRASAAGPGPRRGWRSCGGPQAP